MTLGDRDAVRLRGYLLGRLTSHEREAIELDYFEQPETLERLCEIEDELIDEYLSNRLRDRDRESFENHYLSAPHHHTRVGVARQLRIAGADTISETRERATPSGSWLSTLMGPMWRPAALAAATVLIAAVIWFVALRQQPEIIDVRAPSPPSSPEAPPQAPAPSPPPQILPPPSVAQPVTLAFSLSSINVRGAGDPATLRIPRGTDIVALQLEGEQGERAVTNGTAVVRTVGGAEIWRGPATAAGDRAATLARLEIPAVRLQPEDYIVELFERGRDGRDVERHRYFFRVRE